MIGRIREFLWEYRNLLPQKDQAIRWGLVLLNILFTAWFTISALGFMGGARRMDYLWGFLAGFAVASCLWGVVFWGARGKVRRLLERSFVMVLARGLKELSHRRGDRNLRSLVNHTTAVFKAVAPYLAPVRFWPRPKLYILEILGRVESASRTMEPRVPVIVRREELLLGFAELQEPEAPVMDLNEAANRNAALIADLQEMLGELDAQRATLVGVTALCDEAGFSETRQRALEAKGLMDRRIDVTHGFLAFLHDVRIEIEAKISEAKEVGR